ncbi:MAG: FecR family protein [bacterium]
MANAALIGDDIKAQAREWLLRVSLDPATSDAQAQCAAWRAADPRHEAAFLRFESIWQDAAALEELKTLVPHEIAHVAPWRKPATWAWAGGLAAAAAIALVAIGLRSVPTHFATGVAEVREIPLPDGSEVTLGARSSLDVAYRDDVRQVALTAGEAFFSVAKNPQRPFLVVVGDKQVRVVGTKFEIRRSDVGLRVSVVEGTVEVRQAQATRSNGSISTAPQVIRLRAESSRLTTATLSDVSSADRGIDAPGDRLLVAGQQVTATIAGAIEAPRAMPHAEPAAWRHGRLVYVDATLREVVADANRYSRETIAISDDQIANLRVSVTYPSSQVEEMVTALARSMSLEIEHRGSNEILLKASTSPQ